MDQTLGANRIKAGDKLIREHDHLGRHDDTVTVKEVRRNVKTRYILSGYWRELEYPESLCSQGYRVVERNGERIGTFFVKYW